MKYYVPPEDNQACLPGMKEKPNGEQIHLHGLDGKKEAQNPAAPHYYLSLYELDPNDILKLRAYDTYGIHRIVYTLFERVSSTKEQNGSGILHADLGKKKGRRQILILSNREPSQPERGRLASRLIYPGFFEHSTYRFSITINPVIRNNKTGRIEAIKSREAIEKWFMEKAPAHGFELVPETLQTNSIQVDRFKKGDACVTLGKANLGGQLSVTDKELFIRAVQNGIGRGKAFGCGLLQIAPVSIKIL